MPTRKWGDEQLVNSTVSGNQFHSDVAALAGGGFVVVWEDESAGPDAAIRAQRYDASGNPIGGEMLIAPKIAANDLFLPKVAGLANGDFYVSWTQFTAVENYIFGKVYNAGGALVRDQPVVFAPTHISNGDLSPLGGGATAAWLDPTGGGDIYLRLFDSAGTGGGVITVSNYPDGFEGEVVVAASPDGSTVAVAWSSGESGDTSIPVRFHTAGGAWISTLGGAAPDNVGYVSSPGICWLSNGQFVLTWRNQTDYTSGPGDIRLRVFNFDGTTATPAPFTEIILANSTTLGEQQLPVITALPGGEFVVAWVDYGETGLDDDGAAIRLQAFDASGGKIGGEIVVNTTTTGSQIDPSITALRDGRVVVSWTDNSSGNNDIRVQIVDPRDGLVTGTSKSEALYGHATVDDEISGGGGNDTASGLGGDDALYGGVGNDSLLGGRGDDVGFGGAGNDTFNGGTGEDEFAGGGGNDLMNYSPGADVFNGGAGIDTASYSAATALVKVTLNGAALVNVLVGGVIKDTVRNVENVYGGTANDTLTGDSLANTFIGFGGNDSLVGVGGNDFLRGGLGNDTLNGGTGFDTAYYSDKSATVAVTLNASSLVTVLVGGVAEDRIVNIEAVTGGSGNDTLGGDSLANRLTGGGGADRLNGAAGNDTLIGGAGADLLIGSAGADRFDFDLTTETPVGGRDTVSDFSRSQADKIDLAGIDAIVGGADNPFVFVGTVAFSAAGQVRAVQSGAHTILELNTSGAGGAEAAILLSNFTATTLASTDFVL